MAKEALKIEELVSDAASKQVLQKAIDECVDTCFTRNQDQKAKCKFGTSGVCCRICHMGPCRITPKAPLGTCGADADTIVARNFLREVVAGTAAHSDHGRHLVLKLKKVAQGKAVLITALRIVIDAEHHVSVTDHTPAGAVLQVFFHQF